MPPSESNHVVPALRQRIVLDHKHHRILVDLHPLQLLLLGRKVAKQVQVGLGVQFDVGRVGFWWGFERGQDDVPRLPLAGFAEEERRAVVVTHESGGGGGEGG